MLAGRIDILHLKDMGRNQNGPFITEVGNGNIWWEATDYRTNLTGYIMADKTLELDEESVSGMKAAIDEYLDNL